jgi:hypothetical protein
MMGLTNRLAAMPDVPARIAAAATDPRGGMARAHFNGIGSSRAAPFHDVSGRLPPK